MMGVHFENGLISPFKAPGLINSAGVATLVDGAPKKNKISLFLGVATLSEANGLLSKTRFYKNGKPKPEHWRESYARHQEQKKAVYLHLNPRRHEIQLPCVVRMIRYSPGELDPEDNLRIAQKWVKDAIAEVLTQDFVPGRADGDKRIKWEYDQTKSNVYDVKIEIEW